MRQIYAYALSLSNHLPNPFTSHRNDGKEEGIPLRSETSLQKKSEKSTVLEIGMRNGSCQKMLHSTIRATLQKNTFPCIYNFRLAQGKKMK